jgi:hypothetical protein
MPNFGAAAPLQPQFQAPNPFAAFEAQLARDPQLQRAWQLVTEALQASSPPHFHAEQPHLAMPPFQPGLFNEHTYGSPQQQQPMTMPFNFDMQAAQLDQLFNPPALAQHQVLQQARPEQNPFMHQQAQPAVIMHPAAFPGPRPENFMPPKQLEENAIVYLPPELPIAAPARAPVFDQDVSSPLQAKAPRLKQHQRFRDNATYDRLSDIPIVRFNGKMILGAAQWKVVRSAAS